jgi:two-component system OmpR family response regulator
VDRAALTSRPTILIAEDDPDIRQVLHDLLEDEGYAPLVVANGQEALDLALAQQVDVILLDLQMPVVDGEAFCRAYREHSGTTPVVLLTAAADSIVQAAVTACGAVGYISKPFDLARVIETVALHLPASA